jgi:hypothetical protein
MINSLGILSGIREIFHHQLFKNKNNKSLEVAWEHLIIATIINQAYQCVTVIAGFLINLGPGRANLGLELSWVLIWTG